MNSNPINPSQETKPEDAQALTQAAEVYYAQGKLTEAIAFCRRALEAKPDWAPAYVTMGNVQQAQGQIDEAIRFYSEALAFNPDYAEAYANLGSMLYKQGRFVEAIVNYEKAIALKPDLAAAYWNLGNALKQQGKSEEAKSYQQKAIKINPQLGGIEFYLDRGDELANQGKLDEAIATWKRAITIKPDSVDAYCQIGIVLRYQGKLKEAVPYLQKALEIKPDFTIAHQHLCGILRDATNLEAARQAVSKYSEMCGEIDKIMTAIYYISTYQVSGLNQIAKDRFLELESYLYQVKNFSNVEIKALYANLLFSTPYLRDDLEANSNFYRLISKQYIEQVVKPNYPKISQSSFQQRSNESKLKIGFISNHFNRHSVGWCSADIIRELCKLTPNVYLYATERLDADDHTQNFVDSVAKLSYPKTFPNGLANAGEIINEIQQDQLDILVDLDSLSVPIHCDILYRKPAPVCISWLGFDAPYISSTNYFLCDWHTHPDGREKYYQEQLIRMPDSFAAVGGFKRLVADTIDLRKSHRIGLEQVVYLCVSPGRKFNRELVKAQVAILKQVPNSVLLHKAIGDIEVFQSAYHQACEAEGIGKHRIKFLPRVPTEEEHRLIYLLADVFLDSYPYNGGTHTLEALWFNLPVVTRVGEQFLSRMGYSFMQALKMETGISWSWEEYTEWGVKLGNNLDLRNAVKEQLRESKKPQTLAPLWNPKKFAKDMYGVFVELLAKAK
ncbi:tetratricopeptide repeat protein [Kamptonema sp. UHCC 0994]|uniref:tetratricopeptide repeat protein n=1 Tax=Kamptonema sp. UHCC 0994 TaxID=3031329 RepID=UPI0023BAA89C|nr:tetratricopeptide repeat protein [Kamptonema sp. UHCC 0994]MDF0556917.1 tetratricopeptide repeat protein [Kamptonema sp. UHCC 0994]